MRKLRKSTFAAFLCVLVSLCSLSVSAKVTVLKSSSLKKVTEAQDADGEWVKMGKQFRFRLGDGTYKKNCWFQSDGKIYYTDSRGNRLKGWVKYRKHLYYLNSRGELQTGWLKKGQKRYYLKVDGSAATGLYKVGAHTYYFSRKTGAAVSGWVKVGKKSYYFSKKTFRLKKSKQASAKSKISSKKPMVALTFDDGPGKYTDRLLDCLKKNKARATFFMVGSNVPYYKSVVKRMAKMGCELGNHSYSHPYMTGLSSAGIATEISKTSSNIKNAAGRGPTLCRLPYGSGASDSRVLSALGLPSVYWSIDTRDWANTGNPSHTVNAVLNHVQSGDIVLMHDIHYSTVVAAEKIIPELRKRGYQLVTVSQLAKYKGKTTLHSGRTYYHFR